MEKGCKNHRKPHTPQRERLCMLWGNPVIFTDCRENPMTTIGQPFSIDIAEITYGNPVNPCKHLQCNSFLQEIIMLSYNI